MGIDRHIYFGPYLKLKIQEIDHKIERRTCTNIECGGHGKYSPHSFCNACGSEINNVTLIEKRSSINLHEFMNDKLGNEDLFQVIYAERVGIKDDTIHFLIANYESQGGFHIGHNENAVLELAMLDINVFKKGDWKDIVKALTECNIKHETKIGLIAYYS